MNTIKKALFIAPHPDDESLGCGGTIQKLKDTGSQVYWMIVTRGYPDDGFKQDAIDAKKEQIVRVNEAYGFDGIFELGLRTTLLDTYQTREIIGKVGEILHQLKPDTLFIPHHSDVHSDHRVIFDAVWSSSKSFRTPFVKNILSYETVSETEFGIPSGSRVFAPNVFIDISDYLERKLEIISIYHDEIQSHPFPRSLENLKALAHVRGSVAFVDYAEAFMCLKSLA
ncbi:MAG: PIG-L family deacetylase [Candidatus Marinimicrobia bacterium]|nr:PIG-L family deacetylase [Candidatus Neomarinimicrobiota bacterium]